MTDKLRYLQVFSAIQQYSDEHRYPPTLEELREMIGSSSKSLIQRYLLRLEQEGCISRRKHMQRTIRIIKEPMVAAPPVQRKKRIQRGYIDRRGRNNALANAKKAEAGKRSAHERCHLTDRQIDERIEQIVKDAQENGTCALPEADVFRGGELGSIMHHATRVG